MDTKKMDIADRIAAPYAEWVYDDGYEDPFPPLEYPLKQPIPEYKVKIKPKLMILYGSETGTGEEVAERMARESISFQIKPVVSAMDDYLTEWRELLAGDEPFIVCFICSTTGQGDVPKNMQLFWKHMLRKNLRSDYLKNIKVSVIGLGDSSYAKYNFVGKKLYNRLGQLGATYLTPLYLADDQHDLGADAAVTPWLNEVWKSIFTDVPVDSNGRAILNVKGLQPKLFMLRDYGRPPFDFCHTESVGPNISQLKLKARERVTNEDHFQNVLLLTFDMEGTELTYNPGDVLVLQPQNLDESIKLFHKVFAKFKDGRKDRFYIMPNTERPWGKIPHVLNTLYPQPWSLDFIVKYYFDLQIVPKRNVFEMLAFFTSCDLEREKLLEFCTPEGQQEMFAYSNRPRRTVIEVCQDFPHAIENITEDYLFDLFTPIKPRSFSIASSMKVARNEVQILVAVVEFKTKLKKPRLGLCSNFLKRLRIGEQVPAWIEPGSFKFPTADETPLIMVGPGTGCAPFRSMIAEKHGCVHDLVLFFGCRGRNKDYFFQKEWTELEKENELKVFAAFSRDSPDGSKVYVQHLIKKAGDLIWDLISNKNGVIFIAGNAKQMPTDVQEAFIQVFKEHGAGDDPTEFMKQLVKYNRYQTEVWS